MKTYSLHIVYIFLFLLLIYVFTTESVKSILDPTYIISGWRYKFPRALVWYITVFLWYILPTTAYRVDIINNDEIKIYSIHKRIIISRDKIISVEDESKFFVKLYHYGGEISVCTLIDGIGNIKNLLGSFAKEKYVNNDKKLSPVKILIIVLLIAFAVYVEYDHISRLQSIKIR